MISKLKHGMFVKSYVLPSITASTWYASRSESVALDGFTPIGVVGWSSNQAATSLYRCDITGTGLTVGAANIHQANINNLVITVYVLYA